MPGRKVFLFFAAVVVLTGVTSSGGFCKTEPLSGKIQEIELTMITEGNYKEAIPRLNAMLEISPDNPRIYMLLGLAHYGLMEYTEAYKYLKAAERIGAVPGFGDLLSYAILTIEENRDILERVERAKNALESGGDTSRHISLERMASGHFAMINELSEKKYQYAAIMVPHIIWLKRNMQDFPGLYAFSGDVYYSGRFYEKAIDDYKKAIEEDPENPRLYRVLADCQVAIGAFDSAQENYEKAIELYKKSGLSEEDSRILRLKKIKQALPKTYSDVTKLIGERHFREAEEICRKRISLNSADYIAITQLGEIYWKQGKKRAAVNLFRKAIRLAPDYPMAHFFLGRAYFFEHKTEKALAEFAVFEEKMDLLPEKDEDTTDFYVSALHYIGYMYSTLRRYQDTIKKCKKIIELDPDDQKAHYNLAVCYYVHYHNRPQAYHELRKVIEIDPHTRMADMARYYIEYLRRNPDFRVISDFTFFYED